MPPRKRRGKVQIAYQILIMCKDEGASKTRIVYALNLNFANVANFLDLLIKNGFLESDQGNTPLYKTTRKGIEFLEQIKAIQERFPELCDQSGWHISQGG
jgi:predicted transcriptional regulator